ncbi:YncE family protein [Pseudomonas nabeulensis]|uniref:YncE family protein n=1 Tax=Pseudomonas nabeulensis TaxID=2293833 RepID=A0A4Z0BAJ3_9PSED|nr:YncE family protein [Pseudomonas nabeulensis]TFY96065.1 YncE family protein [Pseudomonas nabeulensis]
MRPARNARPPVAQLTPYIPGLKAPVVGFSGAVNKALLESHGNDGLICILRSYASQAEGDFIALICANPDIPVDTHTVTDQEAREQKAIVLRIPLAHLSDGAVGPVYMVVTHLDSRREETQRLTLKVDQVAPTGNDPIVAPPWVNERLARPQLAQTLIDSTAAQRGVAVSIDFYPVDPTLPTNTHRSVRDQIRLIIGSEIIEHVVTEGQASNRNPIAVTVNYGSWLKIGSGRHACAYDVLDESGNYTPGRSPSQMIEVRLNPNEKLLDPAHIVEAPSGTLDADKLAGKSATLRFPIAGKGWASGDTLRASVKGRTLAGVELEQIYSTLVGSPAITYLDIPWPNADLSVLIGALTQLSYERLRPGQPGVPSENSFIQVTGTPVASELDAPHVPAANGGVLDPLTDPVRVIVRSYMGQHPDDCVTLVLDGKYANGHGFYQEHRLPAGTGDIPFDLANGPEGDIRQLESGTLRLYYYINLPGQRPPSKELNLLIGEPIEALPKVQVLEAPEPDLTFDPEISRANANVTVKWHTSFVLGTTVVLYFEGSALGGSAPPMRRLITDAWLGEDLKFVVPRVYVLANLNRSARLYYSVERPGQRTLYSQSLVMKVGSALQLNVPLILQSTVSGPATATLNPLHVLPPAAPVVTLRIRYPMMAGDDIQPIFKGTFGLGTPVIAPKPADPALGYVDFSISNHVIAANLGLQASVSYIVTRGGASTSSQILSLTVETLPAQHLDRVSVPQAAAGVIDVSKAHSVRVLEWPFMRNGQSIWIDIKGAANLPLREGTPLSAAEFAAKRVEHSLPAAFLRSLPNRSTLTVETHVSLNGSLHKDFAVKLGTVSYRIENTKGVMANIRAAGTPTNLALSADGTRLYLTQATTPRSVAVIDTQNYRVIHTITDIGSPLWLDLHPNGSRLYVSDNSNAANTPIRVISTQDYSTIHTLTGFTTVHGLTLNKTGTRLYVADYGASEMVIIDTTSHNVVSRVPTSRPSAIALSPDGTRAHIAGAFDWRAFNLANNAQLSQANTFSLPQQIAHSPMLQRIYITQPDRGTVVIGNTTTLQVSQTLSGLQRPYDVAFHPKLERAYVTQSGANLLTLIDTRAQNVIGTYAGFSQPRGVVVSPDGVYAYVANASNDTVSVVVL